MPNINYDYTVTDFPNNEVNISRLYDEIKASSIGSIFVSNTSEGTVCSIWFSEELSSGEQTTLDGIVATHSGEEYPLLTPTPYNFAFSEDGKGYIQCDSKNSFSTGAYFIFGGNDAVPVSMCKIIMWLSGTGDHGEIRLYDSTNNKVIFHINDVTNTEPMIHFVDTLVDIPDTEAIFELQYMNTDVSKKLKIASFHLF